MILRNTVALTIRLRHLVFVLSAFFVVQVIACVPWLLLP